jgi:hypothetical protein
MDADPAGSEHRARDRDSRAGARHLSPVATVAAVSRAPARKALGTPARIYYKYEGVSPAGSHKPNTAVPQAFYNAQAGVKRLTTETGAGQWGTSLAFAGTLFGLEVLVFQVRVSYDQKPYRRAVMETYGARCIASPSNETEYGRAGARAAARPPGQPRHRDLRGGRTRRAARRHQVRAGLGAEPRADAPDRHRAGVHGTDARWPMPGPMSSSAAPAAARTSPASPSRSSATACAAAPSRASSPSSRPRARRSPAVAMRTTSATPAT